MKEFGYNPLEFEGKSGLCTKSKSLFVQELLIAQSRKREKIYK
jgi:hypothetical protein